MFHITLYSFTPRYTYEQNVDYLHFLSLCSVRSKAIAFLCKISQS